MTSPYHAGELAVQARAGVLAVARRVGGIVQGAIPAPARAFLEAEQFAVVAAADADGRVWASLLTGAPGVLRAHDPHRLHLAAAPAAGDPLAAVLAGAPRAVDAGVLVIDLATRRRLRVNGPAEPEAGGSVVHAREVYWNCPKYIQRRLVDTRPGQASTLGAGPARSATLTDAQRAWVGRADTFFIGSGHAERGADASHRGGEPGFVQLARDDAGGDVLVFPDYAGNAMFNTLGNLAVHPAAGLLFVDFARGATLQLTGTAEVLWGREQFATFPGAERAVRFRVTEAVELPRATVLRWRLVEHSPFNPPPPAAVAPGFGPHSARRVAS